MTLNRRQLLAGAGAFGLASCATRAVVPARPVAPPQVTSSIDRVTRTVVGLRPFRPPGFRLDREVVHEKTVVHNYGHGGCGVTLSWGTSMRAAEMVRETGRSEVAVLGGGVMGITTAYLLARQGLSVTIYADSLPPNTTSNVAGALWLPSSLYDRRSVDHNFMKLNTQVTREAFRGFLPFVNRPGYGVFWTRHSDLSRRSTPVTQPLPGGDDIYPGLDRRTSPHTRFNYPSERRFFALMIDPDFYLDALLKDAQLAGARIEQRHFGGPDDVAALPEPVIVNCTGLGAGQLFADADIIPIRGQLTHLMPQPEIDFSYVAPSPEGILYMFPRRTGLVLGGSHQRGNNSLAVDPDDVVRMVEGHASLAGGNAARI